MFYTLKFNLSLGRKKIRKDKDQWRVRGAPHRIKNTKPIITQLHL